MIFWTGSILLPVQFSSFPCVGNPALLWRTRHASPTRRMWLLPINHFYLTLGKSNCCWYIKKRFPSYLQPKLFNGLFILVSSMQCQWMGKTVIVKMKIIVCHQMTRSFNFPVLSGGNPFMPWQNIIWTMVFIIHLHWINFRFAPCTYIWPTFFSPLLLLDLCHL